MRALFNPDSKLMRAMSRIGDLMVLNLIFLISCVPVITIGAALTAMYHICFRFDTKRESGVLRAYFRAFRAEFRQATLVWLILLVLGVAAGVNTLFFYAWQGALHGAFVVFAIFFVLILLTAGYAFPLLSQFSNGVIVTIKNALFLSLGHLPRSVVIVLFNCLPFAIFGFDLYTFFEMGFLWAVVYFAAAAYGNSILLKKVFAPYRPPEPEENEPDEE